MLEASVIVPTRDRAAYLRVALASLAAQDLEPRQLRGDRRRRRSWPRTPAPPPCGRRQARRPPCATSSVRASPGLNSARNTGVSRSVRRRSSCSSTTTSRRRRGWLRALLEGRRRHAGRAGARRPDRCCDWRASRLRLCGREAASDHRRSTPGPADREVDGRVGRQHGRRPARVRACRARSTPGVPYGFDEDMWERRLRERGGTVMYVARRRARAPARRRATPACDR